MAYRKLAMVVVIAGDHAPPRGILRGFVELAGKARDRGRAVKRVTVRDEDVVAERFLLIEDLVGALTDRHRDVCAVRDQARGIQRRADELGRASVQAGDNRPRTFGATAEVISAQDS